MRSPKSRRAAFFKIRNGTHTGRLDPSEFGERVEQPNAAVGQRPGVAASPEASYCRHHERLIERYGEEAVRAGTYPRRRTPRTDEPLKLEAEPITNRQPTTIEPGAVRPALAQAAASSLDEIQAAILDAALGATREHWATFTCPDCGKKQRTQVSVPDVRARVAALELWLHEGLGRVPQAEEARAPRLPENAEPVKNISWGEMQLLFATIHADEIAAVIGGTGSVVLRERLARLSEAERDVLREALTAPAPA